MKPNSRLIALSTLQVTNGAFILPPNLPSLGFKDFEADAARQRRNKPKPSVSGSIRRAAAAEAREITSGEVPRQVSCDPKHPWFHPLYFNITVKFNEVEIKDCVSFDADAGEMEYFARDAEGALVKNEAGDGFLVLKKKGLIEASWTVRY